MLTVTLYTKPGCSLCDEAKAELESLAAEFPHRLTEMSILDDPQLYERYRHLIPVVLIGPNRLVYPFSTLDLRAALQAQFSNP